MFLPKELSEKHNIYVVEVYDICGSLAAGRLQLLVDLDQEIYGVQNQLVCSKSTKKLGAIFDKHYGEDQAAMVSHEEISEDIRAAGLDKGVVFKLIKWETSGMGRTFMTYCETHDELPEFVNRLLVALGEKDA